MEIQAINTQVIRTNWDDYIEFHRKGNEKALRYDKKIIEIKPDSYINAYGIRYENDYEIKRWIIAGKPSNSINAKISGVIGHNLNVGSNTVNFSTDGGIKLAVGKTYAIDFTHPEVLETTIGAYVVLGAVGNAGIINSNATAGIGSKVTTGFELGLLYAEYSYEKNSNYNNKSLGMGVRVEF